MAAISTPNLQLSSGVSTRPVHVAEPKGNYGEPEAALVSENEGAGYIGLTLLEPEEQYLRNSLESLTSREREVMIAICIGGTNDAIASRLCIALPTLRTHLMRLNQKLGTTSKGDVIRFAASILIEGYRRGALSPMHAA